MVNLVEPNESFWMSHLIPRHVSVGSFPLVGFVTAGLRFPSGIVSSTGTEFEMNFVRLNPPLLHKGYTSETNLTASTTVLNDFNKSSTQKFSFRDSVTADGYSC